MRVLFTILLICCETTSFGQPSTLSDSLTFCHIKYKVPAGCTLHGNNQLMGDDYSLLWRYVSEEDRPYVISKYLEQLTPAQKKTTYVRRLMCYLSNQKVVACKLNTIKNVGVGSYRLVTCGVINGQPVFVELSLKREPKTNSDIPAFPRQFIRLAEQDSQ